MYKIMLKFKKNECIIMVSVSGWQEFIFNSLQILLYNSTYTSVFHTRKKILMFINKHYVIIIKYKLLNKYKLYKNYHKYKNNKNLTMS